MERAGQTYPSFGDPVPSAPARGGATGVLLGFALFYLLAMLHVPLIRIGARADADSIGLFDLLISGALILLLPLILRQRFLHRAQPFLLYLVFILYAAVVYLFSAIVFSQWNLFGALALIKLLQYGVAMLLFWWAMERLSLQQVVFIFCIAGIVFSINGFARLSMGLDYRLGFILKAGEATSQPAGFFLGLNVLFLIFCLKRPDIRYRWFLWACLGLFVAALTATLSRSNQIALMAVLPLLLLSRTTPVRAYFILLGFSAVFAAFIALVVSLNLPVRFVYYLLDPTILLNDGSFQSRYSSQGAWWMGVDYILDHPLSLIFGKGFGYVWRIYDGLIPQLVYSTGIIGTGLALATAVYFISRHYSFELLSVFLFILIGGIGSEGFLFSYRAVMPSLAIIMATALYFRRTRTTAMLFSSGGG